MHITEQFIQSKTGKPETCEDAIYINDHFAVIIDGVTNKTEKTWGTKTPGQVARDCILSAIPAIPAEATASYFIKQCNDAILQWYNENKVTIEMQHHIDQRCTASIVVYSNHHRELWMVGTGQAIVNNQYISKTKLIDDLMAQTRALYLESEMKKGATEKSLVEFDSGREFIKPLLLRQVMFQNSITPSEFNYYEIDGFFEAYTHIDIISVPQEDTYLVIASDGYPEIFSTLSDSEELLQKILRDDPLCYKRYKSTHGLKPGNVSFDDRSYIKIDVTK